VDDLMTFGQRIEEISARDFAQKKSVSGKALEKVRILHYGSCAAYQINTL
jgi:hypothetical protein